MTAIGKLIDHKNHHLRMVAIRRAWALLYLRRKLPDLANIQFNAAHEELLEMRVESELGIIYE
jgi:hypothetical protein